MTMGLIDFSNCPDGYQDYGGSDNKYSIEYNQERYMVKLPEFRSVKVNDLQTSHVNNVLSEYIGSHIVGLTGLPVQETLLGTFHDQIAVACKDFTNDVYHLQEFSWFMRATYEKSQIGRIPTYKQIYEVPERHPLLHGIKDEAIQRYWDTFVVDALLGNFDRHKGNWGFLVSHQEKDVKLAPIYDCGSCLYPGLSEDRMKDILSSREEIEQRIYVYPKPALNRNDNPKKQEKFGYLELLSTGIDKNCTEALKRIYPRISMDKINHMIENVPVLSDQRIEFYEKMLGYRKELILDKAMEIVLDRERPEYIKQATENLDQVAGIKNILVRDGEIIITPEYSNSFTTIRVNVTTHDARIFKGEQELSPLDAYIKTPQTFDLLQKVNSVLPKDEPTHTISHDIAID